MFGARWRVVGRNKEVTKEKEASADDDVREPAGLCFLTTEKFFGGFRRLMEGGNGVRQRRTELRIRRQANINAAQRWRQNDEADRSARAQLSLLLASDSSRFSSISG